MATNRKIQKVALSIFTLLLLLISFTEQAKSLSATHTFAQVTSINQLVDIGDNHWAFKDLKFLIEEVGTLAGYPDGTVRGNLPITRYEVAALLNASLDRINELIAAGLADAVTREDVAVLQRLEEEFSAELGFLISRLNKVENDLEFLEKE